MNKQTNSDHDEILYMDEIPDESLQPLTAGLENPLPSVEPRFGPLLETDNNYNPRPTSGPEIDDLEPGIPSRPGDKGIDDGLIPETTFGQPNYPSGQHPFFPQPPNQPIPDVNIYQHKKTLAQGMMDLALLSANANQLRYVLQTDGRHPYYYPSLTMITSSLLIQVIVGIGLIWNSRYDVKVDAQMCKADTANNWTVIGIFLVTVLNVFISSFGVIDLITTPTS
ncbi:ninjurin-1-like [Vespa mandarinia]|uniref:ninjurin-1-like n=1 Tax=Vespa mandarinia TaxID=7446 RepID=UPI001615CD4F|nr:ninjurin-1-like [Vespa mandarinia]XP_046822839.1 ninjurin-A [Vespa crabro]